MRWVLDYDTPPSRKVVWYSKHESLHFADVYSIKELEDDATLPGGTPSLKKTILYGDITGYASFEHPTESERSLGFIPVNVVLENRCTDRLLSLSLPSKDAKEPFQVDSLVLAKANSSSFLPAKVVKCPRKGRFEVEFLQDAVSGVTEIGVKTVSNTDLITLDKNSPLRIDRKTTTSGILYAVYPSALGVSHIKLSGQSVSAEAAATKVSEEKTHKRLENKKARKAKIPKKKEAVVSAEEATVELPGDQTGGDGESGGKKRKRAKKKKEAAVSAELTAAEPLGDLTGKDVESGGKKRKRAKKTKKLETSPAAVPA